jgi:S1-C subfamily serine protease
MEERKRSDNFWKVFSVILLVVMVGMMAFIILTTQRPKESFRSRPTAESRLAALSPALGTSDHFWVADLAEAALPFVVNVETTMKAEPGESDVELSEQLQQWQHMLPEGMNPTMPQSPMDIPPATGVGSGFIIREDGYIVTNAHVIKGGGSFKVRLNDGRELDARLVGMDEFKDLGVLKVDEKNLPVAPLGDSTLTRIGEPVIAIGSPIGYQATVTAGIISTNNRLLADLGRADDVRKPQTYLQTDAAINRGNSGGPLINSSGEVIGINQAIARRDSLGYGDWIPIEGIGFAIPINEVKESLDQIVQTGSVKYPGISAQIVTLEDYLKENEGLKLDVKQGVYINMVTVGGPADKAGIKAGDVVLSIGDVKVETAKDFIVEIQNHKVGERVTLRVARQGGTKQEDVSVVLKELDLGSMSFDE